MFPFFMHWHGLMAAELAAAVVSLLGLIVTAVMLPETKGRSLDEITEEKMPETPDDRPPEQLAPAA